MWSVSKIKFGFGFTNTFYAIFLVQLVCSFTVFLLVKLFGGFPAYLFGSIVIIISGIYSFYELEKRVGLKQFILNLMRKRWKKD